MGNILIQDIIRQLRDVEAADLWIDENFAKKFSQVNPVSAFIRPVEGMHSIAELVSHLTEWRLEVLNRLDGNKRGLEMSDRANWRGNDELQQKGWPIVVQEFYDAQKRVIALLEDKDDQYLDTPYPHADPDFPYNFKYLLTGLIHHDLYHMGQMGITVKYLDQK